MKDRAVQFNYKIRNGSRYPLESYTYPRLSGLRPPKGNSSLRQVAGLYSGMASNDLWPRFGSEVGYWGSDYPAQLRHLGTDNLFCMVLSDSCGLYVGFHEPKQKQIVQVSFSLQPGYSDSLHSRATDDQEAVQVAAVHVDANHLCFIAAGQSQESKELVLEPFEGSWHVGARIYKRWRAQWHRTKKSPDWVQDVHAWQQIQINSAEDRLAFDYKSLPLYAEACQRAGIRAIQLTGWQAGGQDKEFPVHDTDPRLGTAAELKDAITQCRERGVEVILFNKYAWADLSSESYEREFKQYAILDPYGRPYTFNGYGYDTPTQLAGINNRRGAGMCMASAKWRQRALAEFQKSVALGAGGILFDECQWHMSPLCFSPNHGHPVPGTVFSGDVALIDGFREYVDPQRFLFAGESPYDVELQTYNMSYFRISEGFVPMSRFIDPFAPMSVAVTGLHDRRMINACLLFRFVMSYEPRNFHGELKEMPVTLAYGLAMDGFRRKYRQYVWDAEFQDKVGARVTAGGRLHPDFTVFLGRDGRRAIAVANMADSGALTCTVELDGEQLGGLRFVTPELQEWQPCTGELKLEPGFAAVVLEG